MNQDTVFVEDIYEALKLGVRALGGPKKVGILIWPQKSVDAAAQLLNDCLNKSRSEKLDAEQILFIVREAAKAEFHVPMEFIASDCGYEKPKALDLEEERAKLQRRYLDATTELRDIANQIMNIDKNLSSNPTQKES